MIRRVLSTILDILNIKNVYAAKVIGLTDGTFSLKLKNYKNIYRFFDDEISLMINKLIYEKLNIKQDDPIVQSIKKASKAKELAEALYIIAQDDPLLSADKNIFLLFSDERYTEFIIKLIWTEQTANNKYYRLMKEKSILKEKK